MTAAIAAGQDPANPSGSTLTSRPTSEMTAAQDYAARGLDVPITAQAKGHGIQALPFRIVRLRSW